MKESQKAYLDSDHSFQVSNSSHNHIPHVQESGLQELLDRYLLIVLIFYK